MAALASLFVILADQPGALRDRGLGVPIMIVSGSAIALVGVWAGPQHVAVAAVLTFVVAIGLAGEAESAVQLAIAFAGGGLIAAVVIYLRARARPEPFIEREAAAAAPTFEQILRSPLGWFALLRAAAAGMAMCLGVVAAEALIAVADGEMLLMTVGFLVAAFGMAALQKVNYAVFVACLTALLVLSGQIVSDSGFATATDRLLATLLGAGIAFVAIGLGRFLLGRSVAGTQADPPAEDEDQTPG